MNGNPAGDLADIFGVAFDTSTVKPQEDFPVIPPGKPLCLIEKAGVKLTKAQTGHYIEIQMSVQDEGPYKNYKLWDRINIRNSNTQCVEIGLRTLSALGLAIGVPVIADSAQLVNHLVRPHVKVDADGRNQVRTYSAPEAITSSFPQGQAVQYGAVPPPPTGQQLARPVAPPPDPLVPPTPVQYGTQQAPPQAPPVAPVAPPAAVAPQAAPVAPAAPAAAPTAPVAAVPQTAPAPPWAR